MMLSQYDPHIVIETQKHYYVELNPNIAIMHDIIISITSCVHPTLNCAVIMYAESMACRSVSLGYTCELHKEDMILI